MTFQKKMKINKHDDYGHMVNDAAPSDEMVKVKWLDEARKESAKH